MVLNPEKLIPRIRIHEVDIAMCHADPSAVKDFGSKLLGVLLADSLSLCSRLSGIASLSLQLSAHASGIASETEIILTQSHTPSRIATSND